jgi:A/G-specific adenine glycosylase
MSWSSRHQALYPWRRTKDPYRILVSEFMLHRTQAKQVIPVYSEFVRRYPTLRAFMEGNRRVARRLLDRLGLAWRADGMVDALAKLSRQYGKVPTDYDALTDVPGIGPYIAGATLAFSENRPIALVDSNTVRVVGRVFGLDLRGEARRRSEVIECLRAVAHPSRPREYHYALIDLAHELCRLADPACEACPLARTPCMYARDHARVPFASEGRRTRRKP